MSVKQQSFEQSTQELLELTHAPRFICPLLIIMWQLLQWELVSSVKKM